MKKISAIRIFSALLFLFVSISSHAQEATLEHVDIHAFSDLIAQYANDENAHIIDVRTPEEFHAGHIKGAKVIDFYNKGFIDHLKSLDKDDTYLLYCRSGNRSGQTLRLMGQLGFTSVYDMKGGMKAWTKAQYPVVK